MNGNVLIVWCNGDIKMALRHNLNSNYALRNFEQFLATFDALLTPLKKAYNDPPNTHVSATLFHFP